MNPIRRPLRRLAITGLMVLIGLVAPRVTVVLHAAVIDNLVAYWSLGEASGDAIDDHAANDLTDNASVGSAAGKVGNARDFERDNLEYFVRADNTDLSVGDEDFTICAWLLLESKPSSVDLGALQKTTGGNGEYFLQWRNNDGTDKFAFAVFGSSGFGNFGLATADTLGSPSTGVWYFVCGWHDSVNDQLGIQVNNGTANTVSHTAGVFDGTGDFTISGLEFSNYWDGLIDEVGFWKKVLTAGEKTFLYNSGSGRSYSDIQNEGAGGGSTPRRLLLMGVGQ